MDRPQEYRQLMEQIRRAHQAFTTAWAEARADALKDISPKKRHLSWAKVWDANGIAYKAAKPFSDNRDKLLGKLFLEYLIPLYDAFVAGHPDAVSAIIEFLEVDVPAFRCGYAKEEHLKRLKTVPLTDEHRERLKQYGLHLCSMPHHRREIGEAGRLMIKIADRDFVGQLRALSINENERVRKKATKMLGVVLNGRKDLV